MSDDINRNLRTLEGTELYRAQGQAEFLEKLLGALTTIFNTKGTLNDGNFNTTRQQPATGPNSTARPVGYDEQYAAGRTK
jgi:hypothetical protein